MKSEKLTIVLLATLMLAACGKGSEEQAPAEAAPPEPQPAGVEATAMEIAPGLTMRVLRAGSGEVAQAGQVASVHYTGWLHDPAAADSRGNKFDSSVDRNEAFEFALGAGRVIRGWDQGVAGMQIGEIRELTIAPELAYGDRQVGNLIPPGSTLVFEVELLGLRDTQQ
ncbi:MAG: FKBP-type peptidyl-prolyl cis-trans isomerase [Gammaproteobacteria bacterium]|nr:FKBP-type peptidyl-prolyl cis-trans isomerase [Gammaproteobacteria bacterium]MDH5311662.1 FKBP-type peptidyl-prolyl cis-trans isomerase [Gammaproteobacteria bacterium]